MNRLFKVMPQHLNRIQVRTLTRPLQSLHFVFLQPFRGGFAGVFWIIVLLQNPSSLQLEVTNRWPDIVLQDFLVDSRIHGSIFTASLPGPEGAKQPQTITLPPYFTVGMIRGAATDSGPPGQQGGGGGIYIIEIAIVFPSQSFFFPLLPNQIILFQLLKSFSFVCNGKVIIFCFVFL